jgi:hypothetical protein
MTHYQDPFTQPYVDHSMQPKKTSGMAITALVFSLIGIVPCCGIIPAAIGVLLGAIGFATLGPTAAKKGRGMSIAAIIVGVAFTALWGYLMFDGYKDFINLQNAPALAIQAGEKGDIAKFREMFPAPGATDDEAKAFIAALNSQYGKINHSEVDLEEFIESFQAAKGQQVLPFRFKLVFEHATVDADLMFNPKAQNGDDVVFDSITIIDSAGGNLTFPKSAAASPPAAPSGSSPPPVQITPPDADAKPDGG